MSWLTNKSRFQSEAVNTYPACSAAFIRQHQQVKNRQQSMLMRAAQELGLPEEVSHYWNPIQGKIDPTTSDIYSNSNATMS